MTLRSQEKLREIISTNEDWIKPTGNASKLAKVISNAGFIHRDEVKELLLWCKKQFNLIKLCHMDCDVPDSEHDMFRLADEGNTKLSQSNIIKE